MINRKSVFLIRGLFVILFIINGVNAFGIASRYSVNNPLIMGPGETREIKLTLVLSPGEESLVLKPEIIGGNDVGGNFGEDGIAEIIEKDLEYAVNQGEEVPFGLKISVPSSADIGKEYVVSIGVKDITASKQGGMVSLKGSLINNLKVLVARNEEEDKINETKAKGLVWLGIIGIMVFLILIVILIIWLVARNRD